MLFLIGLIIVLLTGSALCSSSEAALLSVSKNRLQVEADSGNKSALAALKVKEKIGESIGTIAILNNIFNIVGTLIIGSIAQALFNNWQFALFSGVLTGLLIVFGEILAKNLGERYALRQMLMISGLINLMRLTLYPIVWLVEKIIVLIFGKKVDTKISEEEIKVMVEQGLLDKEIEHDEHEIIHNVFTLNDKTAADLMTPRVNIYGLDGDKTLGEQRDVIVNSNHSRLPVFFENYDTVEGFVLLTEALTHLALGKDKVYPKELSIEMLKIQETTQADSLLVIFRKSKKHIALVVDKFNGTSGIVTLEDVLEELVGEIVDETDKQPDMREVPVNYQEYART